MIVKVGIGEKVKVQFTDSDGEFEIHFDSPEYPKSIIVKESAGLPGSKIGNANEIIYHETFGSFEEKERIVAGRIIGGKRKEVLDDLEALEKDIEVLCKYPQCANYDSKAESWCTAACSADHYSYLGLDDVKTIEWDEILPEVVDILTTLKQKGFCLYQPDDSKTWYDAQNQLGVIAGVLGHEIFQKGPHYKVIVNAGV